MIPSTTTTALLFLLTAQCSSYTLPRRGTVTSPRGVATHRLSGLLHSSTFDQFEERIDETNEEEDVRRQQRILLESFPVDTVELTSSIQDTPSSSTQQQQQQLSQAAAATAIETPTLTKILSYTLPAIGVWLCSPILSMIDTAAVGLLSGTAQQAALNPAVSVTDYGALVVAFMYTATTNLIAAAQQHDKSTTDNPRTTTTLLTGLQLAIVVGTIFGIVLSASARHLITTLIGNDTLDPTVLAAALRYVRIRSLGMPAALVIGTAQSACLGMQDVKSPLYVLLAAAMINFMGDVLLVGNGNLWLGGAAGAAWATVFSQYGALFMFWRWLTTVPGDERKREEKKEKKEGRNGQVVNVTRGIMELTGTSEKGQRRRRYFQKFLHSPKAFMNDSSILQSKSKAHDKPLPKSRGFLANKLHLQQFLRPSNLDIPTAKEYLPFVIPVTTTSVGRISGYIAMSHVASSTLGTLDMAAHQIIFSIFCCLTPIVDGLSQVAQSFVPAVFEHKIPSRERAVALAQTVTNFRKCGVALGAVLVSLVACIPWISRYFTTDVGVLHRVNGAIPGVALFLVVNGLMCAGEGSLLGQKDLRFLRNMYTIFFFTVPAYMLRLKQRSLLGIQEVSIGTMWAAFSTYNLIRTCIWHLRLAQLQRRTERSVVVTAA
ncbi:hypothetical protein HJC23_010795 [Cyclotella cryptica]|uniref:Multidrug and toxic compound extrusion protein n=1 Tax=Cyclotella cryptica TaxID=29204 RepID=A0ABD3QPC0_9STRA|eukprot:CCRYP_003532-RA/>CCRYP_003532-RA protein AED:0.28 eAED:0.28 QI:399/1/1/1/1/1/3/1233/657